jgi:DNA repair protein RecO (recombination protein O)
MAKVETVEAICLKAFPYGESSKIAIYWSQEHGELRAMVKGVRKANSALTGACEALTHNHLVLRKGSADLYQVVSVTCGERFIGLRLDLRRMAAAQMLVEWLLCNRLDPQAKAMFDWLRTRLTELSTLPTGVNDRTLVQVVNQAQMQLLELTGMPLQLNHCMQCGNDFPTDQAIYFAPAWGGAICKACRDTDRPAVQLVGVSAPTWQVLINKPEAWMTVDPAKLQQFWMFLAQHWWQQELTAHQFWISQIV